MENRLRSLSRDKKGDFTGILYVIAMIAGTAFFLLIAGYISTTISTEIKNTIGSDNILINNSFDATINVAQGTLSAIWYIVFGGLLLSLLVTSWYMPTHPVMIPIFIILLVVAVIIGVAMSNAYEQFYAVPQLSAIADTQGSINFMMSNLAYIALVIGVIGLIVTFAKPGGETAPIS